MLNPLQPDISFRVAGCKLRAVMDTEGPSMGGKRTETSTQTIYRPSQHDPTIWTIFSYGRPALKTNRGAAFTEGEKNVLFSGRPCCRF